MTAFAQKMVLMMAGGTGGHVYPALAVARALAERGASIHWLGNGDGFEGRKVPADYPLHDIAVKGLRGNGLLGWLKAPVMVSKAIYRAHRVIKAIKPDVVIGMGGFAAGPGGVAAYLHKIPLLIHEQNAVMGLTNKLLARVANKVLLGDELAAEALKNRHKVLVTGSPVRADIAAIATPEVRFAQRQGKVKLLLIGGSLGAKALNELLPQALALLDESERPLVTHQTGERWLEATQQAYAAAAVEAQIVPFIDDMCVAYGQCDWLIARAGALTVAEVATVGVSALFVPFPYAVDDHQTANAQQLLTAQAATLVQQNELSAEWLAEFIRKQNNRPALLQQAQRGRACSHAQALDNIIDEVAALI